MIDRFVIYGGLDDIALTQPVLALKRLSDAHDGYHTFVAKNRGKAAHIPAVHQVVVRSLFDEFDQRGADARRFHARQHLMGAGTRHRNLADGQVFEAHAVKHQRPHFGRDVLRDLMVRFHAVSIQNLPGITNPDEPACGFPEDVTPSESTPSYCGPLVAPTPQRWGGRLDK